MEIVLQKPKNDNPGLSARFVGIPGVVLQTYSRELLDWAANLHNRGEYLELCLWNPPGVTAGGIGYQGNAKLRCSAAFEAVSHTLLLTIAPATAEDGHLMAKHGDALPAILRAMRAYAESKEGKKHPVRAVFDLPDYFVERYGFELREWGRNLAAIGLFKTIVLREGTMSDLSPDPEIGAVLAGVKLEAKINRRDGDEIELLIGAATEMDERTIENHVAKMQRAGIPAGAQLVEPPRPGVPTFPDIIGEAPVISD